MPKTRRSEFPDVEVQWWPFRPRYIRRVRQYLSYTTGRCSPMALVRDENGTLFGADVMVPPQDAFDTWTVRACWRKGMPRYQVSTKQIVDIECARVVAGYEC